MHPVLPSETRGLPLEAMIDVRLVTRSGNRAAITCAIMPPIDTPTTCARAMPRASRRPVTSFAMSSSVYGARTLSRNSARPMASGRLGRGPRASFSEWPQSRLSKRHDAEAAGHQTVDERVGPSYERHAQPHDQHQGRCGGIAPRLVGEREAVGLNGRHAGSDTSRSASGRDTATRAHRCGRSAAISPRAAPDGRRSRTTRAG